MATTKRLTVTKRDIPRLRKMLEAKHEELRGILGGASRALAAARGEQTADLEDMAVQSHEEWLFLNRNTMDKTLAREIGDALERVKDGSYGMCDECGEPMLVRRLEAIPWARFCVRCQDDVAGEEPVRLKTERAYR